MSRWVHELVKVAAQSLEMPDLLVEIMGTLAALTPDPELEADPRIPRVPWAELCESQGLLDLLHRLLVAGFSEDDLVLECVMVTGLVACDPAGASLLAVQDKFLAVLQELLAEKQDDDEIILQLLYTFHCLVLTDETRDLIMQDSRVD